MDFSKQELELLLDMAQNYESRVMGEIESLPDDSYGAKHYLYNYRTIVNGITEKIMTGLGRNPRTKRTKLFEDN
jgi:hypothetical protein